MKILAVDDDAVNRKVMGAFLTRVTETHNMEYVFTLAVSGIEALRLCMKERFDLIFMDIMMPEMDGIDAVKAIRGIYKRNGWEEALIVMVTACGGRETVVRARDAGAVGYLMKPINGNQLIDWIQLAAFGGKNCEGGDVGLTNERNEL